MRFSNLPLDYFKFQFHKGTIRTLVLSLNVLSVKTFQFHKGTIRTGGRWVKRHACFISIP